MPHHERGHFFQRLCQPIFKFVVMQGSTEPFDDGLPLGLIHMLIDTPVGDQFDIAFSQQQIDEHAIVLLSVPNVQFAKHHDRTLAHGGADRYLVPKVTPQVTGRQASFHANPDFTAVALLTR